MNQTCFVGTVYDPCLTPQQYYYLSEKFGLIVEKGQLIGACSIFCTVYFCTIDEAVQILDYIKSNIKYF